MDAAFEFPLPYTRSPILEGVAHGFFEHGGVKNGSAAFQFGYGGPGDPHRIAQMRAAAARTLAEGAQIVTPHQVHSADVLTLTWPWQDAPADRPGDRSTDRPSDRPVGDALVTAQPGLAIGIVTADCAPVLLADPAAGVIGAAHAGWRGALGGILEQVVAAMEALGAARGSICAAIGPTIAQPSYEVDDKFYAHFGPNDARFFAKGRQGHWQFDLPAYAQSRLEACGIGEIAALNLDTYTLEDRFYSYRRASHHRALSYGRQLSLILLN